MQTRDYCLNQKTKYIGQIYGTGYEKMTLDDVIKTSAPLLAKACQGMKYVPEDFILTTNPDGSHDELLWTTSQARLVCKIANFKLKQWLRDGDASAPLLAKACQRMKEALEHVIKFTRKEGICEACVAALADV